MLRVTKLTDYATVVLTVLAARPGEILSASDLAEHSGLETPTVSKVLKPLAQCLGRKAVARHRRQRGRFGMHRHQAGVEQRQWRQGRRGAHEAAGRGRPT